MPHHTERTTTCFHSKEDIYGCCSQQEALPHDLVFNATSADACSAAVAATIVITARIWWIRAL